MDCAFQSVLMGRNSILERAIEISCYNIHETHLDVSHVLPDFSSIEKYLHPRLESTSLHNQYQVFVLGQLAVLYILLIFLIAF